MPIYSVAETGVVSYGGVHFASDADLTTGEEILDALPPDVSVGIGVARSFLVTTFAGFPKDVVEGCVGLELNLQSVRFELSQLELTPQLSSQ